MQKILSVNSNKGFTLVELMVSIVILLVAFISMMYALGLYARHNVRNTLRKEAVKIAQECAERLRLGNSCNSQVSRKIRAASYQFNISAPNPSSFSSGTNSVTISVNYNYKDKQYTYTINTVIYR